jgi:2-polyprenyl-3-methyl-5-hydroxy-6-metoxy-1,4-benzoquinol methylase
MRMAKVLLLLKLFETSGADLRGKRVFDYGFGAGTFFRYCPSTSTLAGVEIDPENVDAVRQMLARRGVKADLQAIQIENWVDHPLLDRQFDVVVASHILEHLTDPVAFLRTIRGSVNPGGFLVGLVPLNERKKDPHHVRAVERAEIFKWAEQSGWRVRSYFESDPWLYWIQPIFSMKSRLGRLIAQTISLSVGVVATAVGSRIWFGRCSDLFRVLTRSLPTQAAFVLDQDGTVYEFAESS